MRAVVPGSRFVSDHLPFCLLDQDFYGDSPCYLGIGISDEVSPPLSFLLKSCDRQSITAWPGLSTHGTVCLNICGIACVTVFVWLSLRLYATVCLCGCLFVTRPQWAFLICRIPGCLSVRVPLWSVYMDVCVALWPRDWLSVQLSQDAPLECADSHWLLDTETASCVSALVQAIKEPWEAQFGVELQQNVHPVLTVRNRKWRTPFSMWRLSLEAGTCSFIQLGKTNQGSCIGSVSTLNRGFFFQLMSRRDFISQIVLEIVPPKAGNRTLNGQKITSERSKVNPSQPIQREQFISDEWELVV